MLQKLNSHMKTHFMAGLQYIQYLCVRFECQSLAGASFCRSLWTLLDCVLHESAFHRHSLGKKKVVKDR